MLKLSYAYRTHAGLLRETNQDAIHTFASAGNRIFVVCDGVGGLPAGERASALAVQSIEQYCGGHVAESPYAILPAAFSFANENILQEADTDPAKKNMATTCIAACVTEKALYFAHLGDCRLYSLKNGKFEQQTRDHTLVQELSERNELPVELNQIAGIEHVITKALGIRLSITPDVGSLTYDELENSMLLICTDGLFKMLTDEELVNILSLKDDLETKAQLLLDLALQNGGADNVSFFLLGFDKVGLGLGKKIRVV